MITTCHPCVPRHEPLVRPNDIHSLADRLALAVPSPGLPWPRARSSRGTSVADTRLTRPHRKSASRRAPITLTRAPSFGIVTETLQQP